MPLIKSIAGVRGTIGGQIGEALTPIDVVAMTTGFGRWLIQQKEDQRVVIGRDARLSGAMISQLVCATLQSLGIAIIDLGLSTTPTVALAVPQEQAGGGIVITASHNPATWNALKLLNKEGECIDATATTAVFALAAQKDPSFVTVDQLGSYITKDTYIERHIRQILALPLVDVEAIQKRKFKIAVDAVNSTGGIAVPKLLQALGVLHTTAVNCQPTGHFAHDPEPLPVHLTMLATTMQGREYDVGIAVDPDVDRLAILDEKGMPWGEDYTLVAVADYVLRQTPGNTVTNLTSSSALKDITVQYGGSHATAAVGELHVVAKMKATQAVLGGEGNGGVIYPALHYGRDALVGIALLLSHLARSGKTASALRASYPNYALVKKKVPLTSSLSLAFVFAQLKRDYCQYPMHTEDGLKILLENAWIHLRKSNTEPVLRIHAEAPTQAQADRLATQMIQKLHALSQAS